MRADARCEARLPHPPVRECLSCLPFRSPHPLSQEGVQREDESIFARCGQEDVLLPVARLRKGLADAGNGFPRRLLIEAADREIELMSLQCLGQTGLAASGPQHLRSEPSSELPNNV